MSLLLLLLLFALSVTGEESPKTASQFLDRFRNIAKSMEEAVGTAANCSTDVLANFVKGEKNVTWGKLHGCVSNKSTLDEFKIPLKKYREEFVKLVEAEKKGVEETFAETVNRTRGPAGERTRTLGERLDRFAARITDKLRELGVRVKESQTVKAMRGALTSLKESMNSFLDKVIDFF